MHPKHCYNKARRWSLSHDQVIKTWNTCRGTLGWTAAETRRFLKHTCTESDLNDADRLYYSKEATHAERTT